jgi:hypothetical protein
MARVRLLPRQGRTGFLTRMGLVSERMQADWKVRTLPCRRIAEARNQADVRTRAVVPAGHDHSSD